MRGATWWWFLVALGRVAKCLFRGMDRSDTGYKLDKEKTSQFELDGGCKSRPKPKKSLS